MCLLGDLPLFNSIEPNRARRFGTGNFGTGRDTYMRCSSDGHVQTNGQNKQALLDILRFAPLAVSIWAEIKARMQIRIRGPSGSTTALISDGDTVSDLLRVIRERTGITNFDVKLGYPPRPLQLGTLDPSLLLAELSVKLDGEQLLISERDPPPATATAEGTPGTQRAVANKPLSLARKPTGIGKDANSKDAPEVSMPSHGGTLVLRIMPDDNSCLFRAFGSTMLGSTLDSMTELRSLVASAIQARPDVYTAAVLDRARDDYCRWIQTADSWGGGIELAILSAHFDVEVCSIDVQSLRVDRFNDGRPKRCILVYSGIHYDAIAFSPGSPALPPDCDVKVFDAADDAVLAAAVELCRELQRRHYYTDTAAFSVRCQLCGAVFVGQNAAQEHAAATGHYEFGEAE
ncbi:MAG: hypothetical protein M1825_001543 [Sarcosagium campestre]|nr:MAG: hypothetical protein M1825_001543 [Sarcosagium campestre]